MRTCPCGTAIADPRSRRRWCSWQCYVVGHVAELDSVEQLGLGDDRCWSWPLSAMGLLSPYNFDGVAASPRFVLLSALTGYTTVGDDVLTTTCEKVECVNPAHAVSIDRTDMGYFAMERRWGAPSISSCRTCGSDDMAVLATRNGTYRRCRACHNRINSESRKKHRTSHPRRRQAKVRLRRAAAGTRS